MSGTIETTPATTSATTGRQVLATWVRKVPGGPMESRDALDVVAGEGVVGDHTRGGKRHVTLIFADDWAAALRDLGSDVPPSARRANVLVSGGSGGALIGRRVRLGGVLLEIGGETRPCGIMDEAAPGLMEALRPDARAGVWGRALEGGRIAPGARLEVLDA